MDFCDMHGHYAWGIDDGMPNEEDCKKALEMAGEQGIHTIIATPHVKPGLTTKEDHQTIEKRVDDLKSLARSYDINVFHGCELMLNEHINEAIKEGIYTPFEGTKYMLVEYDVTKPTEDFLDEFDDLLRNILIAGYKPIIAHVERYFHEEIDLEYVQYLLDLHCVIQINTTSILGLGSRAHYKNALALLENNMVHVVATDTHRCEGTRVPNMAKAAEAMSKLGYPKEYAELLMHTNPYHLIHGESVEDSDFKRGFFAKLFKH
jgi:protein-tyrosine phosphatase